LKNAVHSDDMVGVLVADVTALAALTCGDTSSLNEVVRP
jgi:hypothetical protein